ncbi:hypothetical protein KM043_014900 [Ampulex compressa]|nr:hypothetical protein KM043_014900 [Ampulex compressa]
MRKDNSNSTAWQPGHGSVDDNQSQCRGQGERETTEMGSRSGLIAPQILTLLILPSARLLIEVRTFQEASPGHPFWTDAQSLEGGSMDGLTKTVAARPVCGSCTEADAYGGWADSGGSAESARSRLRQVLRTRVGQLVTSAVPGLVIQFSDTRRRRRIYDTTRGGPGLRGTPEDPLEDLGTTPAAESRRWRMGSVSPPQWAGNRNGIAQVMPGSQAAPHVSSGCNHSGQASC